MPKREKTGNKGVYYREAERIGGDGKEKVYYIVFKDKGKMIEEKVGRQFADKMNPNKASIIRCERIEGKRSSRKEIRETQQRENWTINKLWSEYKDNNHHLKGMKQDESRFINFIAPKFGKFEPENISAIEVQRFRTKLENKKKPATVKNILELLRRIINYGVKSHLCKAPEFTIQMPKVNNIKTEDLSPEELNRLLQVLDKDKNIQVTNFMKMVLFTGMRRSELFKLKWADINFEKGLITLRDPKGNTDQILPLNESARELLSNHPKSNSEYVFPGRDGDKRTDINKQVNRIKKLAGLPDDFRPLHGLRHTYASMLASSGKVDMYTLQRLLTHKSPQMTQRYAHLRDETLRRASNLTGQLINEAVNSINE